MKQYKSVIINIINNTIEKTKEDSLKFDFMGLTSILFDSVENKNVFINKFNNYYQKEKNRNPNYYTEYDGSSYLVFLSRQIERLEHFLSLPINEIQNYNWKDQNVEDVIDKFEKYEEEWKSSTKELIPFDEDDEVILKIDNYYWVDLKKSYCSKEGKAMGHCGNSPRRNTDDTIYSLRLLKTMGKDKYWHPFVTVTVDDNLMVWECKGRGNYKPADRYIPYVVELFKQKEYIAGQLDGVGYKPENNLNFKEDFTKEQQKEIYKANPKFEFVGDEPLVIKLDERGIVDYISYNGEKFDYESYSNREIREEEWDEIWEYVIFDYENYYLLDRILDDASSLIKTEYEKLIEFYTTHNEGGGQEDAKEQAKKFIKDFNEEIVDKFKEYIIDHVKEEFEEVEELHDDELIKLMGTRERYDEIIEFIENKFDDALDDFDSSYVDILYLLASHYDIEMYSETDAQLIYNKIYVDQITDDEIMLAKQLEFDFGESWKALL